jgi:HD-GYP domain-containing protein (c-di-GMP phosphodiesterase class II)
MIDDGKELSFSTQSEHNDGHFIQTLRRFSADILDKNSFKWKSQGPYNLYGRPLKVPAAQTAALVAYSDRENGPTNRSTGVRMRNSLAAIAELIENWECAQQEAEQVTEQLGESFEAIALYSRITPQIMAFTFSENTLRALLEDLFEATGVDLIFTSLPSREGYSLFVRREEASFLDADPHGFIENLIDMIPADEPSLKDGHFVIQNSKSVPDYEKLHPEAFRFLATAIGHQGVSHGWLGMVSFSTDTIFRYSELRMATTVAKQLAVTLSNKDLYIELEHLLINVVSSLVHAIEAKDVYTKGHSERVSLHCLRMAEKLCLSKQERNTLLWASILHDIGKIGIPESILNKPGKLSAEEFGWIKMHPGKGYDILKPIRPLANALEGILHHHERLDGEGYPSGLRGDEIPLQARIIAVADTFDAITSDRPYRPGATVKEALSIMGEVAGTQLDAELVQAFMTIADGAEKLEDDGGLFEKTEGIRRR